ncbi:lysophospholipid acyltransferase family protein [Tamaricihabitans halophyticus]|uniref:lysophospholipid acyltransferase family protein n=1 Tax=Tamaricihabitans halophyticus TaxID=1262583 RepID=UPI001050FEF9|nr:lysophospholipid acyltransferase family protein [Tamaricihabitans halophyticus]
MLYWVLKHLSLGPLLRLLCRPKVTGRELIPEHGGALLVSNHLAVMDSFAMPLVIRRRVTFPAKLEYFTEPGLKGRLKKWFFSGTGQVPIDRSSGSAAQAALDTCIRLAKEGHLVGIYPEGTRSPDGRLYKGKTGVARIALESRVPVIPVAMVGTDKANPIGSKTLRPHQIQIRFGEPLDFSRYDGLSGDRFVERSITDEIMYALMELSGQEYVDIYAAKAKELQEAEANGVRPDVPAQPVQTAAEVARIPDSKAS